MIADTINRGVDLKPLVTRKPVNQLSYFWNLRTALSSTVNVTIQGTEGQSGIPYSSTKIQLFGQCVSMRSDYEVSNIMIAGSSSYYNALADEAQAALDNLKLYEERCMISGSETTNGYGLSNCWNGLFQCMKWNVSNGGVTHGAAAEDMEDTTAMFGVTRASGTTYLDVSYTWAGTIGSAGATGVLELAHLDKSITISNKKGAKDHQRIFFMSEERVDEANQLLQPQQRFAGTLNLEGGFTISTYKGVPLIGSRYMDLCGFTNITSASAGAVDASTADNSMYLLDLDLIEFRVLGGVDAQHVAVFNVAYNATAKGREDSTGGFFKTYGVFIMKAFNPHVHIFNLTAP